MRGAQNESTLGWSVKCKNKSRKRKNGSSKSKLTQGKGTDTLRQDSGDPSKSAQSNGRSVTGAGKPALYQVSANASCISTNTITIPYTKNPTHDIRATNTDIITISTFSGNTRNARTLTSKGSKSNNNNNNSNNNNSAHRTDDDGQTDGGTGSSSSRGSSSSARSPFKKAPTPNNARSPSEEEPGAQTNKTSDASTDGKAGSPAEAAPGHTIPDKERSPAEAVPHDATSPTALAALNANADTGTHAVGSPGMHGPVSAAEAALRARNANGGDQELVDQLAGVGICQEGGWSTAKNKHSGKRAARSSGGSTPEKNRARSKRGGAEPQPEASGGQARESDGSQEELDGDQVMLDRDEKEKDEEEDEQEEEVSSDGDLLDKEDSDDDTNTMTYKLCFPASFFPGGVRLNAARAKCVYAFLAKVLEGAAPEENAPTLSSFSTASSNTKNPEADWIVSCSSTEALFLVVNSVLNLSHASSRMRPAVHFSCRLRPRGYRDEAGVMRSRGGHEGFLDLNDLPRLWFQLCIEPVDMRFCKHLAHLSEVQVLCSLIRTSLEGELFKEKGILVDNVLVDIDRRVEPGVRKASKFMGKAAVGRGVKSWAKVSRPDELQNITVLVYLHDPDELPLARATLRSTGKLLLNVKLPVDLRIHLYVEPLPACGFCHDRITRPHSDTMGDLCDEREYSFLFRQYPSKSAIPLYRSDFNRIEQLLSKVPHFLVFGIGETNKDGNQNEQTLLKARLLETTRTSAALETALEEALVIIRKVYMCIPANRAGENSVTLGCNRCGQLKHKEVDCKAHANLSQETLFRVCRKYLKQVETGRGCPVGCDQGGHPGGKVKHGEIQHPSYVPRTFASTRPTKAEEKHNPKGDASKPKTVSRGGFEIRVEGKYFATSSKPFKEKDGVRFPFGALEDGVRLDHVTYSEVGATSCGAARRFGGHGDTVTNRQVGPPSKLDGGHSGGTMSRTITLYAALETLLSVPVEPAPVPWMDAVLHAQWKATEATVQGGSPLKWELYEKSWFSRTSCGEACVGGDPKGCVVDCKVVVDPGGVREAFRNGPGGMLGAGSQSVGQSCYSRHVRRLLSEGYKDLYSGETMGKEFMKLIEGAQASVAPVTLAHLQAIACNCNHMVNVWVVTMLHKADNAVQGKVVPWESAFATVAVRCLRAYDREVASMVLVRRAVFFAALGGEDGTYEYLYSQLSARSEDGDVVEVWENKSPLVQRLVKLTTNERSTVAGKRPNSGNQWARPSRGGRGNKYPKHN
jgi:hypothetical protein